MIFVPEPVRALRREVAIRAATGEITEREGFERVLQVYPQDPIALASLARHAHDAGDLSAAERYARQAIQHSPCADEPYTVLGIVLRGLQPSSPLGTGYFRLGLEKALLDSDRAEEVDGRHLAREFGMGHLVVDIADAAVVSALIALLAKEQVAEPPEVEEELRPHRLVHELRRRRTDLLDPSHVDEILANRQSCEPLLIGILKEYGEDFLEEDDYPMVERAIALLGEMGTQASLPALVELQTLQERDVSGPADWAFRRISHQNPAETLSSIHRLVPAPSMHENLILCRQIAFMPAIPGRVEALAAIEEGLDRFPREERITLSLYLVASYYGVESGNSARGTALEQKYGASFSEEARAELRDLRRSQASLGPVYAGPSELTIYDICCAAPMPEPEPDAVPPVGTKLKLGRNAPCWCGSGRKYKNCHLARDRRR